MTGVDAILAKGPSLLLVVYCISIGKLLLRRLKLGRNTEGQNNNRRQSVGPPAERNIFLIGFAPFAATLMNYIFQIIQYRIYHQKSFKQVTLSNTTHVVVFFQLVRYFENFECLAHIASSGTFTNYIGESAGTDSLL